MTRTVLATTVLTVLSSGSVTAAIITTSTSGANAAAIQSTVDAYRASLGTLNPNTPGSVGSGRREINWDGVPAQFSSPNLLPPDFFNVNSPRGVVLSTPGTGLLVSANEDPNTPQTEARFGDINATYPTIFQVFSPQKLFAARGSTTTDVNFFVAGSNTPATVSGFGAVFTDVDLADVTSLEFFDASNASLGKFFVPTFDGGLSFLGITVGAGDPRIARVRVTAGNTPLGPNDTATADVVAMDDFIYGEPIAADAGVPEPSTWVLFSSAFALTVAGLRRRNRNKK